MNTCKHEGKNSDSSSPLLVDDCITSESFSTIVSDKSSMFASMSPTSIRQRFTGQPPPISSLDESCSSYYEEEAYPLAPPAPKRRSRHQLQSVSVMMIIGALIILVGLFGWISGHKTIHGLRESDGVQEELFRTQERLLLELAKNQVLPKESKDLIEHLELIKNELEKKTAELREIKMQREKADEVYESQTSELSESHKLLQTDMAKFSKAVAIKHFGKGPHYVEFQVKIRNQKKSEKAHFTVEMASLDEMPSSVLLFLEQVAWGLWDGTSFYINAPHALFAQPMSGDATVKKLGEMEAKGLARAAVKEYSAQYPHVEYTLGYGDDERPGPNFFINKLDNTASHTGQPCFAKVIIGQDSIDKMTKLKGPADEPMYIKPIDIVSVRLLDTLEQAVGGQEYLDALDALKKKEEH